MGGRLGLGHRTRVLLFSSLLGDEKAHVRRGRRGFCGGRVRGPDVLLM